MNIAWEKAKDEVLRENTAQAIQEQLERVCNQSEKYQRRWVWELFQNALDAAAEREGIEIRLRLDGNFTFSHNGTPFSTKEILHLIFHGSTKREKEGSIGRYGTGFLSTHVISRKVRVNGVLETDQEFDFVLDRSGQTPGELASAMEISEQRLRESVAPKMKSDGEWTSFEYELSAATRSVVQNSLHDIRTIAPIVLAFNPRIKRLQVEDGVSCVFSVTREGLSDTSSLVTVDMASGEGHAHRFIVAEGENTTVIVPLLSNAERPTIASIEGLPKLFVAFPLVGTETLPLPFIVNGPKAKPTEERNGLYLNADETADNQRNKAILESAWAIYADVVNWASQNGFRDLYRLGQIGSAPSLDWLDKGWFDKLAADWLQRSITKSPLVLVNAHQHLPPRDVLFPKSDNCDLRIRFRDVMEAIHGSVVPAAEVSEEWEQIVSNWSLLSRPDGIEIKTENLPSLASRVSSFGTIEGLDKALQTAGSPLSHWAFLNDLYDLLLRSGEGRLFEKISLLPNQLGAFKRRNSLKRDDDLDEELKDIAHSLAHPVRNELLDRRIDGQVQELLTPYGQENLISTLLKLSTSQAASRLSDSGYGNTNARLCGWLVRNQRANELKAFPLITAHLDSSGTPLLTDQRDQLLLPVGLWSTDLRAFADLFPDRNILSELYAPVFGPAESKWLEDSGFLIREPLTKEVRNLSSGDLDSLLERPLTPDQEEKEHLVVGVEVVELSFLTLKDRGILDTVRSSRSKGTRFLSFIFDYLLPKSSELVEYASVSCACGEMHSIHRALWLPPVKERQWVNERRNHYGTPTAQNLARLWKEEPSLKRRLEDDSVLAFLERLGVSASEILMNLSSGDSRDMQKAFVSILNAAGNNPDALLKIAEVLTTDPELIDEFEKRKQRRERTRLNQQLGALIESIFKALFERPDISQLGFRIERTGRGSDFAIEHDLVDDNQEWFFSVESITGRFLVELKSTYESSIGMTHTQAQESVTHRDSFALCVVPLELGRAIDEEMVRRQARFVSNIGEKLGEQVAMVDSIQRLKLKTVSLPGEIEVVIQEGAVRYRVKDQVWSDGLGFDEFVALLTVKLAG